MSIIKVVSVVTITTFAASMAHSGSPDNPGAGGQTIKRAVTVYKSRGTTLGRAISASITNNKSYHHGKQVQLAKEIRGGDPNAANDNGGGND